MMYEYQCVACSKVSMSIRSCSERNDPAYCEWCGSVAKKIISIPQRSYQAKSSCENYPMVNYHLGSKFRDEKGIIRRVPVVFSNPSERKEFYKQNGLVDAVTPQAEIPTMYHSDADGHQDDKMPDIYKEDVDRAEFVDGSQFEEKKPAYDINTGARL